MLATTDFDIAGIIPFVVALVLSGGVIGMWARESRRHMKKIDSIPNRIHVNGIRGKSTVTRLIAGALRESGIATIAKTTGSAAVVVDQTGADRPILRQGAPTIIEQIDVIRRSVPDDTRALVIECMAIRPDYQRASEKLIVRSTIGVLTNVREDHMEQLGDTLPKIARSLSETCPFDGHFITGESDPDLVAVLEETAAQRSSSFEAGDPSRVTDADLDGFGPFAFRENIAVALAVADRLGIDREVALRGMRKAPEDPGASQVHTVTLRGRTVHWVNLFAVNDRESTVAAIDKANAWCGEGATRIALLNNRVDREERALQFAEIAARDIDVDKIAVLGAYEGPVIDRLVANEFSMDRILKMGAHRGLSVEQMLDKMLDATESETIMLIGLVNIHTAQAEALLHHFEPRGGDAQDTAADASDLDHKASA
ncbi:poly-gamma-glutamate synthase PgsB [Halomonas sp. GXIMD04776]|uniref:poly-gamma-glutamate synthase PgsB n=1 Tax=Halomonas sp. GXIMD04776 TaxID=3415605 RepID=UPI003CC35156